jgi:hypothetical protein
MNEAVREGQRFMARRHGYNIAIVEYCSASGGVGYRIKGERHERYSISVKAFLRNWIPLKDAESESITATNEQAELNPCQE